MSILFGCNCDYYNDEDLESLQIFMNELKSACALSCIPKLNDATLSISVSKGVLEKLRFFLQISNQFDGK